MTPTAIAGLGVIALGIILIALFSFLHRRSPFVFRSIPPFNRIRRAASLVVEDGTRLHVSLGNGDILTPQGASALTGLSLLRRMAEITALSDRPPVATAGTALLTILAQDTLREAHNSVVMDQPFEATNARLAGFTPLAFTAGIMPSVRDEGISSNVLIGNFGPEAGLIVEAAERQNAAVVAASDSITAQAVLFPSAQSTLIGEEVFAANAYLQPEPSYAASLVVQDVLRWLVIIALLAAAGLKAAGLL